MKLEMFVSSTFDVWIMSFFVLIGVGFLLFARTEGLIVAGVVSLIGVSAIAYGNHSRYIAERFLLEEFNAGSALLCGMWRGEVVKVDPKNGWVLEEGVGFVKEDVIINDPGVCGVIGKPSPEPPVAPYGFALVSVIGVLSMLRFALMRLKPEESDANAEEKNDADECHLPK